MERRAVVLEVDGRRAVVLTDRGEIRRIQVRWPGLRVGQELIFEERRAPTGRLALVGAGAAAAAAAVGLVLATATGPSVPVAVLSVDINPSLSLAVGADGRVTAISGWDADGRMLAALLAPDRGRPLPAVAARLAQAGRGRGFLGPSAWVLVAGAPEPGRSTSPRRVLAAEDALAENVERLGDVPPAHVVVLPPASAASAARAEALALSLGRYLAAKRAGFSVAAVRHTPVETLARALGHGTPSPVGRSPGQGASERRASGRAPGESEKHGATTRASGAMGGYGVPSGESPSPAERSSQASERGHTEEEPVSSHDVKASDHPTGANNTTEGDRGRQGE